MADRYDFTANVNTGTDGSGNTIATSVVQSSVSMGTSVSANVSGGAKGDRGEKGEKGDPGTGINIVGSVDDPSQLPESAPVGDCYLINGDLWLYDNSQWLNVGNIQGPKGDTGADSTVPGPKGDTGPANSLSIGTVSSGTTASASISGTAPTQTLSLVLPKGDKGDKGDKGNTGDAATISVGSVTTGPAGTSATVNNVGTVNEAILNFVIPRGNTGAPGTNGTNGLDGKTVRSGMGAPSSGLGVAGDFYIDISTWNIYGPKTTSWGSPSSLVGPSGSGSGDMLGSNNLSEITNAAAARTNLGLGNVENTSDLSKPVSTATQNALNDKISGAGTVTDNAVVRFDGTTGKVIQQSNITINDAGNLLTAGVVESTSIMGAPAVAVDELVEYYDDMGILIDGIVIKDGQIDGYSIPEMANTLSGKADTGHTHTLANITDAGTLASKSTVGINDIAATGGTTTSYLRKDGTWSTPTNTTYTEITTAEIDAGSASTSRTMSGRRAKYIQDETIKKVMPVGSVYRSSTNSLPATLSTNGTWTQIYANSGTVTVFPAGFSTPATKSVEPRYEWKRTA